MLKNLFLLKIIKTEPPSMSWIDRTLVQIGSQKNAMETMENMDAIDENRDCMDAVTPYGSCINGYDSHQTNSPVRGLTGQG
jgi:hypothetical protein